MADAAGPRPTGSLVRDLPEEREPFVAPSRPALVELAAAILVVSGAMGFIGLIGAAGSLPAGTEPLLILTLLLNIGSVVVGILVRTGRAWIVAVNYVAVIGFLDLMSAAGSGLGLMLGIADIIALAILFVNKRWFDAKARERALRR